MKKINIGYHNEFEFVVRDAASGEIIRNEKAYNLICDRFWGIFFGSTSSGLTSARCFANIVFGSGTTAPVSSDTALGARIGSKAITGITRDTSTYSVDGIVKIKGSARLESSEFVGSEISEVGLSENGTNTLTKALLRDANGNTISILKELNQVIDIYATFYQKYPVDGSFKFSPASPSGRSAGWLVFGDYIIPTQPVFFCNEISTDGGSVTCSMSADPINKRVIFAMENMAAANGNIGGLTHMGHGGLGNLNRIKIGSGGMTQGTIIKEVIGTGDGTRKGFNPVFGRIKDTANAKVYVNDIETVATILKNIPYPFRLSDVMPVVENTTEYTIYENPYYQLPHGKVTALASARTTWFASNDLTNWTQVAQVTTTSTTPVSPAAGYENYRYWKCQNYSTYTRIFQYINGSDFFQVIIDPAPVSGATVALSYDTDCLAKDSSHIVTGMSLTWQFNEYTP